MATLDDKLLGEKLHYYCDSSDDERDENDEKSSNKSKSVNANSSTSGANSDFRSTNGIQLSRRWNDIETMNVSFVEFAHFESVNNRNFVRFLDRPERCHSRFSTI